MHRVPYGKKEIGFDLIPGMKGTVVNPRPIEPIENIGLEIARALMEPVNSAPLRELAGKGDTVCIVFTDITRDCPDHLFIPPILRELESAGVQRKDITLVCGTGLHRPSTYEEKVVKLGTYTVENYRILDNDPTDTNSYNELGAPVHGTPLLVHKVACESDLLISTGIVEPHQYAGYSGGRKTVGIGAAGEATIAHTHGPQMLDHPCTRLGLLEGNLFHEAVTEAALRAGLSFILNVVLDGGKRPVAVYGGEPVETFSRLADVAGSLYKVPVAHSYDIAIGGVGFPKDANLYQASRAASYIFFAPTPIIRDGGAIIIPARCQEGAGEGIGEQRFIKELSSCTNMTSLLDNMRKKGYQPGAQRAFVMAKVMERHPVVIVGSEFPDIVRDARMIPAGTMKEALEFASSRAGKSDLDVLIIPRALLALPFVSP